MKPARLSVKKKKKNEFFLAKFLVVQNFLYTFVAEIKDIKPIFVYII